MSNPNAFDASEDNQLMIISTAHQDSQHDLLATADSQDGDGRDIKQKPTRLLCSICGIAGKEAKPLTCARCKNPWYCSKECQKKDWPVHKSVCHEDEHPKIKLMKNILTNDNLHAYIQMALVILYDLNANPRPDELMVARCTLYIGPSDDMYTARFISNLLNPEEIGKGTEGIAQVKDITKEDPSTLSQLGIEVWKEAKKGLKDSGVPDDHVVILVCQVSDIIQGFNFSLRIPRVAMERVNSGIGIEIESVDGVLVTAPLSVDTCIQGLNTRIRSDKHNKLRTRAHLTEEDVNKYISQLIYAAQKYLRDNMWS